MTAHLCPSISSILDSEDRINALFCPFRPRDLNPEGYDMKMKFWIKTIEEFVQFGKKFSFTLKQLQLGFGVKGKTPACLDSVLDVLKREGTIMTDKEYLDYLYASTGWMAWSQVNVKKVVTKVVPTVPSPLVFLGIRTRKEEETRYVHIKHLKNVVDQVSSNPLLKNKLMSLDSFQDKIKEQVEVGISDQEEFEYLITYLRTNKLLQVDKIGNEEVILLGDGVKINDVEKGKYDVHRSIEMYETKVDQLHGQVDKCVDNAKKALKQNRRQTAKYELKKKKLIEERITKLLNVIDNLTVLSLRLEEAETDAKILQAYQSGKQALSDVLKKNDLSVDSVTNTMLDLRDVLDEHGEINATIFQPLEDDDISELDAELEQLMKEDAEKNASPKVVSPINNEDEELLKMLGGLKVVNDPCLNDSENLPSPASVASDM